MRRATNKRSGDKGIRVDIVEDREGVALYAKYRRERPDQDNEDWKGLAEVHKGSEDPLKVKGLPER